MKIGELAQLTGMSVETIRFYEREKLMPAPARSIANYRIYSTEHVDRLTFVRHCRSLDMALKEIRMLLRFMDAQRGDCGKVNELVEAHIQHVTKRIRELKALQRDLQRLRSLCGQSREAKNCGILGGLTG